MSSSVNPKRTFPAQLVVIVVLSTIIVSGVVFYLLGKNSIKGIDAVVNARLININAPEEGTVESVGNPSTQLRNGKTRSNSQEDYDDYCKPFNSESLANDRSDSDRLQRESSSQKAQVLTTGEKINKKQMLFTLKNERYSLLPVQSARKGLCDIQTQLHAVGDRIESEKKLEDIVHNRGKFQKYLNISENRDRKKELEKKLQAAVKRLKLAQDLVGHFQRAVNDGAISQTLLIAYQDALTQRKSEVAQLEAQLQALKVNEQEASEELSLSRTPSNYDPPNRLQELDLEIEQEEQNRKRLMAQERVARQEYEQIEKDVKDKRHIEIKAPQRGVLWSLRTQPGEVVKPGELLGQLAICGDRWSDAWIDAWVEDKNAQLLSENKDKYVATMTLDGVEENGQQKRLKGEKIIFVRSGVGRLAAGSDLPVAIDSLKPLHYAQVRISIQSDEPKNDQKKFAPDDPNTLPESCHYIGFTGKIVFQRKGSFDINQWLDRLPERVGLFPNPLNFIGNKEG